MSKKLLEFLCPHCGSTRLPEEVETGVTITTQLSRIDRNGDHDYDKSLQTMEQGDDSEIRWQCASCGADVVDSNGCMIHDCAELGKAIAELPCNRKRGVPPRKTKDKFHPWWLLKTQMCEGEREHYAHTPLTAK